MDGWGTAPDTKANAIAQANTPFIDSLYTRYPHALLKTCGEDVGLPEGQMGNSEVGHMNIGAGRIVYQQLVEINKAIRDKTFQTNEVLLDALNYAKLNNKPIHLIGLVSDGGVHAHLDHLVAICDIANQHGLQEVFIHAFTDGRDTDPKSGLEFIKSVLEKTKHTDAKIATLIGRYYAMDRDKRWERIKLAYDLLTSGKGEHTQSITDALQMSYAAGVTDEFVKPIVCVDKNDVPLTTIKEGDVVLCFNFRTDRCREITEVLTQKNKPDQGMKKLNLYYVTMTKYDENFENIRVIFQKQNLNMTLGEVLENNGKTQIRIAETEKYPHVTFFFSGGREKEFKGEERIMIPSPHVATYDLKPAMSAIEVTEVITSRLTDDGPDFICLNFANVDMVGHTGNFAAAIAAIETVDKCVKTVVESGIDKGYSFLITADHGNADKMINEDGSPNTAHTLNPVPLFYVSKNSNIELNNGRLADLAPTILGIMEIKVPKEMDGKNLIKN